MHVIIMVTKLEKQLLDIGGRRVGRGKPQNIFEVRRYSVVSKRMENVYEKNQQENI